MSRKLFACVCQLENASGMVSAPKLRKKKRLQTHSPACSGVSSTLCPCGLAATLHTMRPVRQPHPLRPIYNMTPWWRRQRCSVVLRTITRKPYPDGASTYELAVFMLPACSTGIPRLTGTLFKVIYSSTWEVSCQLFLQVVYSNT